MRHSQCKNRQQFKTDIWKKEKHLQITIWAIPQIVFSRTMKLLAISSGFKTQPTQI